jgi:hypothetical protein
MNTNTPFLLLVFALILAFLFSGARMVVAAESGDAGLKVGPLVAQASPPHYQYLMERLQQQWRVDPLVADAHNLLSTGWATPACAPRGQGPIRATPEGGADSTEKCIQRGMNGSSLTNQNGVLLCRSSCL